MISGPRTCMNRRLWAAPKDAIFQGAMPDLGFDRSSSRPIVGAPVNPLRVAIVEDQGPIRDGLRFLIDTTQGFHCTGAFATMEDALAAITPSTVDVALVDI